MKWSVHSLLGVLLVTSSTFASQIGTEFPSAKLSSEYPCNLIKKVKEHLKLTQGEVCELSVVIPGNWHFEICGIPGKSLEGVIASDATSVLLHMQPFCPPTELTIGFSDLDIRTITTNSARPDASISGSRHGAAGRDHCDAALLMDEMMRKIKLGSFDVIEVRRQDSEVVRFTLMNKEGFVAKGFVPLRDDRAFLDFYGASGAATNFVFSVTDPEVHLLEIRDFVEPSGD